MSRSLPGLRHRLGDREPRVLDNHGLSAARQQHAAHLARYLGRVHDDDRDRRLSILCRTVHAHVRRVPGRMWIRMVHRRARKVHHARRQLFLQTDVRDHVHDLHHDVSRVSDPRTQAVHKRRGGPQRTRVVEGRVDRSAQRSAPP